MITPTREYVNYKTTAILSRSPSICLSRFQMIAESPASGVDFDVPASGMDIFDSTLEA